MLQTDQMTYRHPLADSQEQKYGIEKPKLEIGLSYLGTLRTRSTDEIQSSNWMLGCETLDRDYADYDQYKEYLCPLGIKVLRFQGGWAKTETTPGVYDWSWLDHIVETTVSRGLHPWIQTGYGNPIYPGAGGENLGAGMPLSQEGLEAYERWVRTMVTRYADRVFDWEVWNEPNFGDNAVNTPEISADFNLRTASIIKEIQPEARISALALGHINLNYVERFFHYLEEHDGCGLFHDVTYHDYVYNPDANKLAVYKMRQIVEKYAPGLILRQGENGAPSKRNAGGALANYDWSEFSQAKWDLRRMLENLGNDIQCSVFSIAEMQYAGNGPINRKNTKGLLETRPDNTVVRPKMAYYAVQHAAAVFDDSLERIPEVTYTHNIWNAAGNEFSASTDRGISAYGFSNKKTGARVYCFWLDDVIPGECRKPEKLELSFAGSDFKEPVCLEMVTGNVYEIPAERWFKEGRVDQFKDMPVYDSPILILEKSLIEIK